MKKPKKRYQTKAEIEALIDDLKHQQNANAFESERLRRQAEEIFQWMAVQEINWDNLTEAKKQHYRNQKAKGIELLEQSSKLKHSQSRFETRLKRLKDTLAVLGTETFEFMEDRSVVLQ